MAKLKPVEGEEIKALIERAQDLTGDAHAITNRLEHNLSFPILEPVQSASSALSASRALADFAHALLIRASLAEQQKEIEGMVRKRIDAPSAA